ncbi:MAG: glutamine synthetase III [Oscillospiraceae bacterium]|nr:glutamine synthetase III [Oscillospiraceae bacterium]
MKVDFQGTFGAKLFDDRKMKARLSSNAYEILCKVRDEAMIWDPSVADEVADAIRNWAMEQGATHFVHWFSPLTGVNSGRHDSFLDGIDKEGNPIVNFSGKLLSKGESDASSFPSGGLRSTFEARGYTIWDVTSPCFVIGTTLYIPTVFASFTGEALDQKAPLLRTSQSLSKHALRCFHALGYTDMKFVKPTMGAEQEYFLVDKKYFDQRLDLKLTGRTVFGAVPAKAQELSEHYYGRTQERVREFMRDVDQQLWELGVPAKTEHNEAAPGQFELACVYTYANTACDHNRIVMDIMQRTALRHGLVCLLYEKPFTGINGSGKHNNYSLVTSTGENLLKPGKEPERNIKFLLTLAAFIKGVDEHADLLRLSAATEGNDFRLGAAEAPPAIVSMYLGTKLENILQGIADGHLEKREEHREILMGSKSLPLLTADDNDRNRTTPFAFTGYKFEFRMVGSSQPLGFVNTIINALVTISFRDFARELETAENPLKKAYEIVGREYEAHKRVLFNGNGYTQEWVEEAARRGLPNLDCTIKAIPTLIRPENLAFLRKSKALTEEEAYARYEIMFTRYIQKINIELKVANDMVQKEILPAAISYCRQLAQGNFYCEQAGTVSGVAVKFQREIAQLTDEISDLCDEMHFARSSAMKIEKLEDRAQSLYLAHRDKLSRLRKKVDKLETIMPKDKWPMPGYTELLFDL